MKIDMKIWYVLALLVIARPGQADKDSVQQFRVLNDFEVEKVSHAKTSDELDLWVAKIHNLRVDLVACDLQRQQGLVPTRCFAAHSKAKEWHLEWINESSAEALLANCLSLALSTKQTNVSDIDFLPEECSARVRRTIEMNRYKATTRHDF